MDKIKTIRAAELRSLKLPVLVKFSSGFHLVDEIKDAILPRQIERTVSLFRAGVLIGHFYHRTEIRIKQVR